MVRDLQEMLQDRGEFRAVRVLFSGLRGIHVLVEEDREDFEPIRIDSESRRNWAIVEYIRERYQVARSIGKWCQGWDWQVSADIWRVSRVPWSIHGSSALRAIPLEQPYACSSFRDQLRAASPFSLERRFRIRTIRPVPLFTFINGESYGPFRKGWATKLPLAVALHLIWLGLAKPREKGPSQVGAWFDKGWQLFFRSGASSNGMAASMESLTAT